MGRRICEGLRVAETLNRLVGTPAIVDIERRRHRLDVFRVELGEAFDESEDACQLRSDERNFFVRQLQSREKREFPHFIISQ